jgi:glutaminyl-tRNA synthetase
VTKQDNLIEMSLLEFSIRQDLEHAVPRGMAVLDPLKVVLTNYPEARSETLPAPWHPQRAEMGTRAMSFGREIYIERDDFSLDPPPKYKRLTLGGIVRLRYAYIIRCDEVVRGADGSVVELRCTVIETSKSGADQSGLKPKGVIHWVSADAVTAEVRLYERLFVAANPARLEFTDALNAESRIVRRARIERAIVESKETRFQFEREGYFYKDPIDSGADRPVFNRIVALKEGFAR